jgi:hypothetical protein
MFVPISMLRRSGALLTVAAATLACSKSDRSTTDSAGGNVVAQIARTVDTGNTPSVTPAAGLAKVTPADAKSVTSATEYKLTEDNFRHFIQATDSLAALRARDPQARAWLDKQINDAGADTRVTTNDAGRKHLEAFPAVDNAINSAGISTKDYFVAAIAIGQAERYMGNPKAAPPTPTLGPNAEFLRAHRAELDRLHRLQNGTVSR